MDVGVGDDFDTDRVNSGETAVEVSMDGESTREDANGSVARNWWRTSTMNYPLSSRQR